MSEKIKVFISYCRSQEDTLRAAIASHLEKLDNVEVIVDVKVIEPSDNIHPKISQKLDECDCVLVSSKSLLSLEVASELFIANEREKTIFLLQKKNDNEQIPKCFYFFDDRLKIIYHDVDDLLKKLTTNFENKNKEYFEVISNYLRPIQNKIKLRELPKFKSKLIEKILEEAHEEIKQVNSPKYNIDVGIEKNFLVRARSIFKNASEVYAVSIDSVSTFWTAQKNMQLAESYIKSQPNNTVRLFVFSSPRTANKYKHILQANHNSYGQNGRVFICSLYSYRYLLELYTNSQEVETYLNKDFGILVYDNTKTSSESESRFYVEAFLDHSELSFKNLDALQDRKINHEGLLNCFQELKKLDFKTIYDKKGLGEEKNIYIKRWNPECVIDIYLWQDELKELFPEERYGDVYHLVFFKGHNSNLENKIREVKSHLNNAKESMQIKSIWFGKKTDKYPIADFQYGQLKLGFDYDYILIMNFKNHEDLRRYYSNPRHSNLRKDLYKNLHKSLELLYGYLDEIKEKDREKGYEFFEKTIEEIVSNHMVRYDFIDKENIDSIAKDTPYQFPYEYNA